MDFRTQEQIFADINKFLDKEGVFQVNPEEIQYEYFEKQKIKVMNEVKKNSDDFKKPESLIERRKKISLKIETTKNV